MKKLLFISLLFGIILNSYTQTVINLSPDSTLYDLHLLPPSAAVPLDTTIHYVKNGGNDLLDGWTDATAWATIAKVNSHTFYPGDSILFERGGRWRGSIIPAYSGTQLLPIVYGAYGTGDRPQIFGSDSAYNFTNVSGNIWRTASNGYIDPWTLDGGTGVEIWFHETDDSISWGNHVVYDGGYTNFTAEYDWSWDAGYIYIYSPTDPNTRYDHAEIARIETIFDFDQGSGDDPQWLVFDNLEVAFTEAGWGDQEQPISTAYQGLTVRNCKIHHGGRKDGGGKGIDIAYSRMLIEDNLIYEWGRRAVSIYLYGNANLDSIIVRNNIMRTCYHTNATDLSVGGGSVGNRDGNMSGIWIYNNIIDFDTAQDRTVNPVVGAYFRREDGAANFNGVYFFNNYVQYGAGTAMIFSSDAPGTGWIENINVDNNTFYGHNPNTTSEKKFIALSSIGGTGRFRQPLNFRNNIFYHDTQDEGGNRLYSVALADDIIYDSITSQDRNNHYAIDTETDIFNQVVNTLSYDMTELADLRTDLSLENNGVVGNPLVRTSDGYLLEGSPAINLASVIPWITEDIYGNARDGTPNSGAVEAVIELDTCSSFAANYTAIPDSFDIVTSGCDADQDTFRLQVSTSGWPTSRTDGTNAYAGPIPPSGRYFFDSPDDGTVLYVRLYGGVSEFDEWNGDANSDTTLVDSLGIPVYVFVNQEAEDYVDAMGTAPADSIKSFIDTCLVSRVKAMGVTWSDQIILWHVYAMNNATSAKVNLGNPDSSYTATEVNTPSFTAFEGFDFTSGDGDYISTTFDFDNHSFVNDSLFLGGYFQDDQGGDQEVCEANGSFHFYSAEGGGNNTGGRIYSGTWRSQSNTDASGNINAVINGANDITFYRDGSTLGTSVGANSNPTSGSLNIAEAQGATSDQTFSMFFLFNVNWDATEVATFNAIVEDFMIHVGNGVQ